MISSTSQGNRVSQTTKSRLVQFKSICRQQNNCHPKILIYFGNGRKHCEKRGKCWLPPFSSFPTMFSKGFCHRVVKSRDCVVRVKLLWEILLQSKA